MVTLEGARGCRALGGGVVCLRLRPDLAAGVVLAVGPVEVGAPAVVKGVDELVRQHVGDLLLCLHVIVTDDNLPAGRRHSSQGHGRQLKPY